MKVLATALLFALAAAKVHHTEDFSGDWKSRWVQSKKNSDFGVWDVSAGKFFADAEASKGLRTTQDAKFYAISSKTQNVVNPGADGTFVLQFEVKHEQNIDCGGGYIKTMASDVQLDKFEGSTPYSIMFGPDICGATKRVHLIFNYKGENHLWKKTLSAETDEFTHLYTLVLDSKNQKYEVHIDGVKKESGSLEEDWGFLKPKEIDDPSDKKPSDWVDNAEMDDPEDKKPEGYDDIPATIVDPDAKKPDDWDTEEDGEWEAPTIPNPAYKGEWKAKRIANPAYKGVWAPKRIANPDYVHDDKLAVYSDIGAIGFDLWQVKSGTIFDNIILASTLEDAQDYAKKTFHANKDGEKKAKDSGDAESKAKAEAEAPAKEEAAEAANEDDEL